MPYTQDMPPADPRAPGAAGEILPPDLAHAVEVGYEPHDIALRGVFIFLISLVLVTVVVLGAMWVVMEGFVKYDRSYDPVSSPVVIEKIPPQSPLQPSYGHNKDDQKDMEIFRNETDAQLHTASVSPTGRHSISIDDAMDQVLPQLPIRPAPGTENGGQR